MTKNEESIEERLIHENKINEQDLMQNHFLQLQHQMDQLQREHHQQLEDLLARQDKLAYQLYGQKGKQNSRQPLCKLIHHFVTEIMQVESDDPKTAIVALKKALLLGSPLQRSLAKSRLVTMEALLSKANRYVNMKEEIRLIPQVKWIGCVRKEDHVIKFTSKDLYDVSLPHEDPLIVTLQIEKYQVQRILVDTRSSSNILFHHCFRSMYREHEELCLSQTLLVGFNRKTTHAVRQLMLEAVRGEAHIIKEELNKLLAANFVREVRYLTWLANVVVVPKKNKQLVLALLVTTRKLCPYFQAHSIIILTMYPLQSVLSKLDLSRWMLRWSMELSEYDINCRPQIALKGQVLADFLIEFTHEQHSNEDKQSLQEPEIWVLYVMVPRTNKE
uniref:Uncharacterized protein n=1 Tax=Vitis vinifera TaxID=29760 RepID=A5B9G9_VITVI|nr:hypothetical protein VITISV_032438 [Vitis vinifera]